MSASDFGSPKVIRNSSVQSFSGRSRTSTFVSWEPYTKSWTDDFEMATISHASGGRSSGSSIDGGGPWLLQRTRWSVSPIMWNDGTCQGPMTGSMPTSWENATPDLMALTDSQINVLGTKAISLAAPTNPSFSLPTAVGEIKKDGMPTPMGTQLWKERTNFLRGSSSEFLNLEFGWKPLVSEIRNFAYSVKNSEKIIEGYRKGSGSKVRRRYMFPPTKSTEAFGGNVFMSPLTPTRQGKGTMTRTEESKSWFAGAFKYHVPIGDTNMSKLAMHSSNAGKLLGVRLTPDTLWNLAPWSWAADWFGNTGDIMSNISNLGTDGLVMQYGYMMSSYRREKSRTYEYGGKSGYTRSVVETKRRVPASPYKFGSTFDGLSNRQKAITAALGITRVR